MPERTRRSLLVAACVFLVCLSVLVAGVGAQGETPPGAAPPDGQDLLEGSRNEEQRQLAEYLAEGLSYEEALDAVESTGSVAPQPRGGPDGFGYIVRDSNAPDGPLYDWVDISATGTPHALSNEQRIGPFALTFPFTFYGQTHNDFWISENGWLSLGALDPGSSDLSNDCPLPNTFGVENLIAGIWDDLDPQQDAPSGIIYRQQFAAGSCPYAGYGGACAITQWQQSYYNRFPVDSLTFEIILLDNDDIVVQILSPGTAAGTSSTTGIENVDATDGLVYACNSAGSLQANQAIRFYHPTSAPDLSGSFKRAESGPLTGEPINYTIVLSNSGDLPATTTSLTDAIPAGTSYVAGSLACTGGVGSCSYDGGANAIGWAGSIGAAEAVTVTYAVATSSIVCGVPIVNAAEIREPSLPEPLLLTTTTTLWDEWTLYDFEANNGGFVPAPAPSEWEWGVLPPPAGAHSGLRGWDTDLDGTASDVTIQHRLSKALTLPASPLVRLYWWDWYQDDALDERQVAVDGTVIWDDDGGTDQQAWTPHWVDLTPYDGQNVTVDFILDACCSAPGAEPDWKLDDVALASCQLSTIPDLTPSRKTAPAHAASGVPIPYTLILENLSSVPAPNTTVVDPLPPGTSYVPGSATNGATYNAGQNRIEWSGDVGATETITLTFAVTPTLPSGTITNTMTLSQSQIAAPVVRAAATSVLPAAPFNTCATFESGTLPPYLFAETTSKGGSSGRVRVTTAFPHSGQYGLDLDTDIQGAYTTQAAVMVVNLAGQSDVEVNFWIRSHDDDPHPEDGLYISDDLGASYVKIYDFPSGIVGYQRVALNLAQAAADAGVNLTDGFFLSFQSYDNFPIPSDGYSLDDICVQATRPALAVVPPSLSSTQLVTVTRSYPLTLTNPGTAPLMWAITEREGSCLAPPGSVGWLDVAPTSGTLAPGASRVLTATFDSTGLLPDSDHNATLCVSHNVPDMGVVALPATLHTVGEADIALSPTEIEASVPLGGQAVRTLTIRNEGNIPLTWTLAEGNPAVTLALPTISAQTSPQPRVAQSLGPYASRAPAAVRPALPVPWTPGQPVSLALDDGSAENAIGRGTGGQLVWLNRFTPAPSDFPFRLEQIALVFPDTLTVGDDPMELLVWEDTDGDGDPGTGATLRHSQIEVVRYNDFSTWNVYTLTTPVTLNGPGDVLLGVVNRLGQPGYVDLPAAIDQSASQGRSWLGHYGNVPAPEPPSLPAPQNWGTTDSAGIPGNWLLRGSGRGICDSLADLPWVSVSATGGSTAPGVGTPLQVTLDAKGLAEGIYTGTLCITSNDPDESILLVPLTLTVGSVTPTATATGTPSSPTPTATGTPSSPTPTATATGTPASPTPTATATGGPPAPRRLYLPLISQAP